ncbi:MAG: hypothetical protein R3330_01540 [Saprospiraceae bacterium]|nr:hypothetical protein [Saprospiraceae bacterium]
MRRACSWLTVFLLAMVADARDSVDVWHVRFEVVYPLDYIGEQDITHAHYFLHEDFVLIFDYQASRLHRSRYFDLEQQLEYNKARNTMRRKYTATVSAISREWSRLDTILEDRQMHYLGHDLHAGVINQSCFESAGSLTMRRRDMKLMVYFTSDLGVEFSTVDHGLPGFPLIYQKLFGNCQVVEIKADTIHRLRIPVPLVHPDQFTFGGDMPFTCIEKGDQVQVVITDIRAEKFKGETIAGHAFQFDPKTDGPVVLYLANPWSETEAPNLEAMVGMVASRIPVIVVDHFGPTHTWEQVGHVTHLVDGARIIAKYQAETVPALIRINADGHIADYQKASTRGWQQFLKSMADER